MPFLIPENSLERNQKTKERPVNLGACPAKNALKRECTKQVSEKQSGGGETPSPCLLYRILPSGIAENTSWFRGNFLWCSTNIYFKPLIFNSFGLNSD